MRSTKMMEIINLLEGKYGSGEIEITSDPGVPLLYFAPIYPGKRGSTEKTVMNESDFTQDEQKHLDLSWDPDAWCWSVYT